MTRALLIGVTLALAGMSYAQGEKEFSNHYAVSGQEGHIAPFVDGRDEPKQDNDDPKQEDKERNHPVREFPDQDGPEQGHPGQDGPDQEDPKKDDGPDQRDDKHRADFMRVDCRYHNDEKIPGIEHCYASAIYEVDDHKYKRVKLGVGCDYQTIYNDQGRVQTEEVGERLSPLTAAFPGVEVFPKGSLRNSGTYESVLDLRDGRIAGVCYVHKVERKKDGHHHKGYWAF